MKSIFDDAVRAEVIGRINLLGNDHTAQWGKMNVYQMVRHCTRWEEMMQGKKHYTRMWIGLLFGRMALRRVLKDEAPLGRNTPTLSDLVIKEKSGNMDALKAKWIAAINAYEHFSNKDFVHVFFGKMTEEQIGYLVYKHIDHHLRQFNV